jgi:hypothetical protein
MDNFQVIQGAARTIQVTLRDSLGVVITTYDGTQPLVTTVWPGGSLAASFAPATTWVTPAQGTFQVAITALETAGLAEGRYQLSTILNDAGSLVQAYAATLDILPAPAGGTSPQSFVTFADLLNYGRSWLRQLQSQDDEAGFLAQQARATSWLIELIVNRWQVAWPITPGDPGYGGVLVGQNPGMLPSKWLRDQLEANPTKLMLRGLVTEIVAKKALAFICDGQVGVGEGSRDYERLARMYHAEAGSLAKTLRAEIDLNGDGWPELAVNLGMASVRN